MSESNSEKPVSSPPQHLSDKPPAATCGDEHMVEEGIATKAMSNEEYISGFRLATVMFSLVLVTFLVMLDASIVATVCQPATVCRQSTTAI